ncbi:MAG TPA: hypothetical protein VKW76_15690 [Candidatus Binatia bacterium]|nr:hypothetical protein [Candidatus Binatia bacterium]
MHLLAAAVAASLLAVRLATAAPDPVPIGPCGPIARPYDAIELPGERLDHLGGTPIARLGLIAFRAGAAVPIPFQIDERRGRHLALPDGPEPTIDDSPGILDHDDLLVFMACDAGEHASAEAVAQALGDNGLSAWREIRIEDPVDHHAGFAYLVAAEHPPTTDRRYVAYDAAHDLVVTARYRVGCVGALPAYFALALAGPLGPNLLDGLRLRAEATLLAHLAHWTLDETQGQHALIAWKAGPVRVVRRSRHRVYLGAGLYLTAGLAHTYFYAQHVFGPGSMKLPFSPAILFRDINAWGGADFRDLRGWRYHAPGVPPEGFAIDGHMDPAEEAFHGSGDWFLLAHGDEAVLVAALMSEELTRVVSLRLLYRDDAEHAAPPERSPGTVPLVGYRGLDVQRLPAGRYWFQLRVLALAGYRPGDERRALAQAHTSLTADVTARSGPAGAPAARR